MPASFPISALTVLGILIVVLGLFVAASLEFVVVGLVAIAGAGILQLLQVRRT